MARILVVGGAGFRNAGDEALLRACIQVCRDYTPTGELMLAANTPQVAAGTLKGEDVTFVPSPRRAFFAGGDSYRYADDVFRARWAALRNALVLAPSPEAARTALESSDALSFVDREPALRFWDALVSADVLVVHGGGILTSATRSRLWEHALTVEIARRLGKRVALRSQQLGPYTDREDRDRIRTILEHADHVTTRDSRQSSRAVATLARTGLVRDQVDDALILRMDEPSGPVLARHELTPGAYLCVGYRENARVGVTDAAFDNTVAVVRKAHTMFGLPVVLLPQGPFDIPILERMEASLDGIPRRVIRPEDEFREPMHIAAHARLMIACPHHSLIFALRSGVPILSPASGDYYLFKNRGSMRFFGLDSFVFDIDAPDHLAVATDRLTAILVGGEGLRDRIAYRVGELRARAALNDLEFGRIVQG